MKISHSSMRSPSYFLPSPTFPCLSNVLYSLFESLRFQSVSRDVLNSVLCFVLKFPFGCSHWGRCPLPGAVVLWVCILFGLSPTTPGRHFIWLIYIGAGMVCSVFEAVSMATFVYSFSILHFPLMFIVNYYIMFC
jgi:hypothetical protein